MDFFELISQRRSMRAFTDQPVTKGQLQQILESINRAPSAGNLQAFEAYVVQERDLQAQIAAVAYSQEFLIQSPIVLVFCAHGARSAQKYRQRGMDLYCLQDATIACTYAMLAAQRLGLWSVWVGAFDEEAVRKLINAPQAHRPVAILPIGYPASEPKDRPRRALEDWVHYV